MSYYITDMTPIVRDNAEYRSWTENLLGRHCMLSGRYVASCWGEPHALLAKASMLEPTSILTPFREWTKFWEQCQSAGSGASQESNTNASRLNTWRTYYDTLSIFVQNQMVRPLFHSRLQQALELKRIESIYERVLLRQTRFPQANEATPEVESWVDTVMANWRSMADPAWKAEDLGPGGKISLGRSVLDVSSQTSLT